MNLQTTKLELMHLILQSKNKELLDSLLTLLQTSPGSDNRVKLSAAERKAAEAGLDDLKDGRVSDYYEFMKEFE